MSSAQSKLDWLVTDINNRKSCKLSAGFAAWPSRHLKLMAEVAVWEADSKDCVACGNFSAAGTLHGMPKRHQ